MSDLGTNLIVRGESLQALYAQYVTGNLLVNRRYQRKLVWTVDEKRAFIDSLQQQLPVPLILVAEKALGERLRLEVIDGLQRLDAVFSFLENKFASNQGYFNLETLAQTKQLMDEGKLRQGQPAMTRDACTTLAGYNLPISVYRSSDEKDVEEVFRRINSNGRHLSRQEIRQAGCLTNFADLVRELSAFVRGDFSIQEIVDLQGMSAISLTSSATGPGVFVDDIFWVKHRILERDQVRESRDEEILADLLVTMLVEPMPAYDSRLLDEFYGLTSASERRRDSIESAVVRDSPEGIKARVEAVLACFQAVFDVEAHASFTALFFDTSNVRRVPRYFEAVFLAIDLLLTHEGRELGDLGGARAALKGAGNRYISIPAGGGTWTAESKRKNIQVVAALLREHTILRVGPADPLLERTGLRVENLLRAAQTEGALVDFKQGFSSLSAPAKLSDTGVQEVARTLTAMANHGRAATGYVLVGVADTRQDAERVQALGGGTPLEAFGRFVVGVDLDLQQTGSLDKYVLWITDKMRHVGLDGRLESQLLRDMRPVAFQGKTVILFTVKSLEDPMPFGGTFPERLGSQTVDVATTNVVRLFNRFR